MGREPRSKIPPRYALNISIHFQYSPYVRELIAETISFEMRNDRDSHDGNPAVVGFDLHVFCATCGIRKRAVIHDQYGGWQW
jgi:hypothetical protein